MILFDSVGHMVSTESAVELHRFAEKIGLKRSWFQTKGRVDERYDHYDLTTRKVQGRAEMAGATKVEPRDIVKRAWWARSPKPKKFLPCEGRSIL